MTIAIDSQPNKTEVREEVQAVNGYVHKMSWKAPDDESANALKALTATSASVVTTITPTAQPDFCRLISVTPGGTTADVAAGDYILTGTDIRGKTITDTLVFLANATLKQVSIKAFKTVTSLLCPIQDGGSATFSIGIEDTLGVDRILDEDSFLQATYGGTIEAVRATVGHNSSDISKNFITIVTDLEGSDVTAWFLCTDLTAI
jgi:hypothetical protein